MQSNISVALAPDNGATVRSTVFLLKPGETASFSATYGAGDTQLVQFQKSKSPTLLWETHQEAVMDASADNFSGEIRNTGKENLFLRWQSTETDGGSTDESVTVTIAAVAGDVLAPPRFTRHGQLIEHVTDAGPLSDLGIGGHNAALRYEEFGNGLIHRTQITLDTTMSFADDAGAGQYGSFLLYKTPAGRPTLILGWQVSLVITLQAPFVDAAEGAWGIGTGQIDDGGDPATTEVNAFAATDFTASSKVITISGASSVDPSSLLFAADDEIFFNIAVDDDAAHAAGAGHTVTGTIRYYWMS